MRVLGKFAFGVAVGLLVMAPQATAEISVNLSVLLHPDAADSRQVSLYVSNVIYPQPMEEVTPIFNRIPNQYDDYPVLAFICHYGHVTPSMVWEFKSKGHKWSVVMAHFGVSPDLLFMAVPRDPGPPYGNAYGHWKKNGKRITPDQITNDDVRFWVNLRMVSAYSAMQPSRVLELRDSGKRFDQVCQTHYYEKHGKGNKPQEAGIGPGNSSGKGNGKAKGHGNQGDND